MKEIILLGRGGQGTVTSATLLVSAASLDGLEAQGFPFFGAERRGAPVAAFVRISDKPLRRHGMFNRADIIVVMDTQLLWTGVLDRYKLREKGLLIVNSARRDIVAKIAEKVGASKAFAVDATGVARELGLVVAGWPVVNTGILGAFSRATGIVSLRSVVEVVRGYFDERLGMLNAEAARRCYRLTTRVGVKVVAV